MSSRNAETDPSVVIVGAGPSGLSLAIELGMRGIRCLVIERNERAGYAPRAKTTHSRTREHMRRWGIADKLAAASPFGVDYPSHIMFVTRLGGHLLKRFDNALDCSPERHEHYSEHGQWIPQYKLEAVLRQHAQSLPHVEIMFGQEYLSHEQSGNGVRVVIRDVDANREWRADARYLVGADGARSSVRDDIGARMEGSYGLSRNFNVIFRAPGLAEAHPHGPGVMYWQINDEIPSLIGPMDSGDLWFFMPTKVQDGSSITKAQAADMIRRSTGIDIGYEVLSSDEWVASRLLADRYRRGRVFLVGDACHLHPPFGGFGMNLGVSDSVDLGWKMAATIDGWAGPSLLDSYEIERRQVHEIVLDAAEANHSVLANHLIRPALEEETAEGERVRAEVASRIAEAKKAEFYARGVVLGYCYRDSPVIVDDGTQADWKRSIDYVPQAIPGCIAPHAWLDDGSSLYDRFGAGFTLLATVVGMEAELRRATNAAREAGLPLTVLELAGIGLERSYGADLALIRPDQHIAWRGNAVPADLLGKVAGFPLRS
jgi:2-polyprenyl-6-methoxyphenol hydroxylase-like FAD-dependent oxidoreductase